MRTVHISQFRNNAEYPIAVHRVHHHTPLEPGFYRASVSLGSFQHHWTDVVGTAYFKGKYLDHWFHVYLSDQDWEQDLKFQRRAYEQDRAPLDLAPIVAHASIWDFYKYIGWDYRRKRFERNEAKGEAYA